MIFKSSNLRIVPSSTDPSFPLSLSAQQVDPPDVQGRTEILKVHAKVCHDVEYFWRVEMDVFFFP